MCQASLDKKNNIIDFVEAFFFTLYTWIVYFGEYN